MAPVPADGSAPPSAGRVVQLLQMRRYAESEQAAGELVSRQQDSASAHRLLARALSRRRPVRAVRQVAAAAGLGPRHELFFTSIDRRALAFLKMWGRRRLHLSDDGAA